MYHWGSATRLESKRKRLCLQWCNKKVQRCRENIKSKGGIKFSFLEPPMFPVGMGRTLRWYIFHLGAYQGWIVSGEASQEPSKVEFKSVGGIWESQAEGRQWGPNRAQRDPSWFAQLLLSAQQKSHRCHHLWKQRIEKIWNKNGTI